MKPLFFALMTCTVLMGCADLGILSGPGGPAQSGAAADLGPAQRPGPDTVRPKPRPSPGASAPTPKVVPETAQTGELGRSVVSLGNPAERGFWVETPLVSTVRAGRVIRTDTGAELAVELRPVPGGGARASLQTLMGLGLSPAALNELVIASP